jgi:hypothetical protein
VDAYSDHQAWLLVGGSPLEVHYALPSSSAIGVELVKFESVTDEPLVISNPRVYYFKGQKLPQEVELAGTPAAFTMLVFGVQAETVSSASVGGRLRIAEELLQRVGGTSAISVFMLDQRAWRLLTTEHKGTNQSPDGSQWELFDFQGGWPGYVLVGATPP